MTVDVVPYVWGASYNEAHRRYPADDLVLGGRRLTRAVDVAALAELTFEWICQLRRAPYSYDWLDNLGRRSPRQRLRVGLDVGDRLMGVFRVTSTVPGHHVTATTNIAVGRLAVTYAAETVSAQRSRLVCRLVVPRTEVLLRVLTPPFAWGDLVMTRKQLLTLAGLAEQEARSAGVIA